MGARLGRLLLPPAVHLASCTPGSVVDPRLLLMAEFLRDTELPAYRTTLSGALAVRLAGAPTADSTLGDPITIAVLSIAQDEPLDGTGDRSTEPDAAGIGSPVARLRAERQGSGDVTSPWHSPPCPSSARNST
jgi:hypothetical protein